MYFKVSIFDIDGLIDTFSKIMEKDGAKWFSIFGLIIVAIAVTIYFIIK